MKKLILIGESHGSKKTNERYQSLLRQLLSYGFNALACEDGLLPYRLQQKTPLAESNSRYFTLSQRRKASFSNIIQALQLDLTKLQHQLNQPSNDQDSTGQNPDEFIASIDPNILFDLTKFQQVAPLIEQQLPNISETFKIAVYLIAHHQTKPDIQTEIRNADKLAGLLLIQEVERQHTDMLNALTQEYPVRLVSIDTAFNFSIPGTPIDDFYSPRVRKIRDKTMSTNIATLLNTHNIISINGANHLPGLFQNCCIVLYGTNFKNLRTALKRIVAAEKFAHWRSPGGCIQNSVNSVFNGLLLNQITCLNLYDGDNPRSPQFDFAFNTDINSDPGYFQLTQIINQLHLPTQDTAGQKSGSSSAAAQHVSGMTPAHSPEQLKRLGVILRNLIVAKPNAQQKLKQIINVLLNFVFDQANSYNQPDRALALIDTLGEPLLQQLTTLPECAYLSNGLLKMRQSAMGLKQYGQLNLKGMWERFSQRPDFHEKVQQALSAHPEMESLQRHPVIASLFHSAQKEGESERPSLVKPNRP